MTSLVIALQSQDPGLEWGSSAWSCTAAPAQGGSTNSKSAQGDSTNMKMILNPNKICSKMILNLTPVYPEQFHQLRKVKSWNHSLQEIWKTPCKKYENSLQERKWREIIEMQNEVLTWTPTNQKCQWPVFFGGNQLPADLYIFNFTSIIPSY